MRRAGVLIGLVLLPVFLACDSDDECSIGQYCEKQAVNSFCNECAEGCAVCSDEVTCDACINYPTAERYPTRVGSDTRFSSSSVPDWYFLTTSDSCLKDCREYQTGAYYNNWDNGKCEALTNCQDLNKVTIKNSSMSSDRECGDASDLDNDDDETGTNKQDKSTGDQPKIFAATNPGHQAPSSVVANPAYNEHMMSSQSGQYTHISGRRSTLSKGDGYNHIEGASSRGSGQDNFMRTNVAYVGVGSEATAPFRSQPTANPGYDATLPTNAYSEIAAGMPGNAYSEVGGAQQTDGYVDMADANQPGRQSTGGYLPMTGAGAGATQRSGSAQDNVVDGDDYLDVSEDIDHHEAPPRSVHLNNAYSGGGRIQDSAYARAQKQHSTSGDQGQAFGPVDGGQYFTTSGADGADGHYLEAGPAGMHSQGSRRAGDDGQYFETAGAVEFGQYFDTAGTGDDEGGDYIDAGRDLRMDSVSQPMLSKTVKAQNAGAVESDGYFDTAPAPSAGAVESDGYFDTAPAPRGPTYQEARSRQGPELADGFYQDVVPGSQETAGYFDTAPAPAEESDGYFDAKPAPSAGEESDGYFDAKPAPSAGEESDGYFDAKPAPSAGEESDGYFDAKPHQAAAAPSSHSGPHDIMGDFVHPPRFYQAYTSAKVLIAKPLVAREDEHDWPKPPEPPADGRAIIFGQVVQLGASALASLEEQGIKRLYSEDATLDHARELRTLVTTLAKAFLALLDELQSNDHDIARRNELLDQLRLTFINQHHLLNCFRPHQAQETVKAMLRVQAEQKQALAAELQRRALPTTAIMKIAIIAAALALTMLASAQEKVDYEFTMQFKGSCTQVGGPSKLTCTSKAPSQDLAAYISQSDAVSFTVTPLIGSYALISSDIVINDDNTFTEKGNISFGIHQSTFHTLYFSTFSNSGRIGTYDEMGDSMAFTSTADITGGSGNFQGAAGMISYLGYSTSDFASFTQYVNLVSSKGLNTTAH
ncbi:uncharacterized protein MONBRDRAFT_31658 [Monosiga brevicollis MX1]|uniref:Jacalin-type lectin domain-containing protein n=1 Tax=Monosiga brevicollis TaxID=81824 RepID=A9UUZ4_MONBE|nr:uncharacterized protein MONBRDRAFT_31658 [Monosiga brevicollis MX1]EDQ90995.1 predicted protein [Monosiga brevicollis MX1]|eukprot:XP_001744292.1 hypothetical protein [Monosiga brevicollis MX1]